MVMLFVENVGLFAENVGLKYRPLAQNVSRTKGIFVGPRDYVCGPLHIGERTTNTRSFHAAASTALPGAYQVRANS